MLLLVPLLALLLTPSDAPTFPQLLSTKYAPASIPSDLPPPPGRGLDGLDLSKLPSGVKPLASARNGSVEWLATDAGLYQRDGDTFTRLPIGPHRPEPGAPHIRAGTRLTDLAADGLGHFWMSSQVGLLLADGHGWWQTIGKRDGVPYEVMTCLHLAPNGDVWGGTAKGAWRLRDGDFRYFGGPRWLPGDVVNQIWSAPDGRVFLSTDAGLAVIEEKPITLADKAAHFDEITRTRHDRRGFINQIDLAVPGDPTSKATFHVSDNDGLWTAIDVAASSFRFAATRDPAAKERAKRSMNALLELERLTGIPGYPARALVTDAELADGIRGVDLDDSVRVPGEDHDIWFRSPVQPDTWCKGDTSSDELDGHYFAWFVYFQHIDDDSEKNRIRGVVQRVTDHIIDHDYTLVGHTGKRTRWGVWHPSLINDDPFYYELRALNSLEILSFLAIAHHITGDERYQREYDRLCDDHHYLLNTLLFRRGEFGRWPEINHSDDELAYLCYYPLLLLEQHPERRRLLVQSLARTWEGAPGEQPIRDERSPLYNAIYGACAGRPCDPEGAVSTLQDWPWDPLHWAVSNSHRHDLKLKSAEGVRTTNRPEYDRVLPASERRLMRWNGSPWAADGAGNGRTEDDGAAWSLAYWIGVHHGFWR